MSPTINGAALTTHDECFSYCQPFVMTFTSVLYGAMSFCSHLEAANHEFPGECIPDRQIDRDVVTIG